jgi:MerR family transcriptional regulator, heat shock protein HspR
MLPQVASASSCLKIFQRSSKSSEDSTPRSARGVYGISVASELSGLGLQTLRLYERRGLLTPSRTDGGTRRYSDDDLERLQRITQLVNQGVNLAGIAQILDLETENSQLKADYTALELRNAKLKAARPAAPRNTAAKDRRSQPQSRPQAMKRLHDRDAGGRGSSPVAGS